MKILHRYILREHLAPFLLAFVMITFLLVIDYVPRIIDRVIDKELGLLVVLELVGLNLAWMLALSVPMSVLVATMMAFGRLSSDFEVTAIKSCGINLAKALVPLLGAGTLLMFLMVQFNDHVLPDLNKKARDLTGDIAAMRPTLIFRSGIFISDIPGYLIQIDKINHTTSQVKGIRIAKTEIPNKPTIIVADSGYLKTTDDGTMRFDLYNGEVHSMDIAEPANYRRLDFDNQVIYVEGVGSDLKRSNSDYRTDREMGISAMEKKVQNAKDYREPAITRMHDYMAKKFASLFSDSILLRSSDTLSDSAVLKFVRSDADVMKRHMSSNLQQVSTQDRTIRKYSLEIQKKYSIPAASLAFILIGAPLGILARRGGMGVAIANSILLFVVYWAFLIAGEDMADRGIVDPFWAMWAANFLISGIGIYLLSKVVTEKPLFSFFRRSS